MIQWDKYRPPFQGDVWILKFNEREVGSVRHDGYCYYAHCWIIHERSRFDQLNHAKKFVESSLKYL